MIVTRFVKSGVCSVAFCDSAPLPVLPTEPLRIPKKPHQRLGLGAQIDLWKALTEARLSAQAAF